MLLGIIAPKHDPVVCKTIIIAGPPVVKVALVAISSKLDSCFPTRIDAETISGCSPNAAVRVEGQDPTGNGRGPSGDGPLAGVHR